MNRPLSYFIFTLILISLTGRILPDSGSPEELYLRYRESGRYLEAMEVLRKWSPGITDPRMAEVNVFRIMELSSRPELLQAAYDLLTMMKSSQPLKGHPFVIDRIDLFRNSILLKTGRLLPSLELMKSFSYFDFHAMGPFPNNGVEEFEEPRPPEQSFNKDDLCMGKAHPVSWFHVDKDRTGAIDMGSLLPDVRDSFFYLYRKFSVPGDGDYLLILGKTGFTDMWLDGKKILSNKSEHGFLHDQYFIKVFLPRGTHRLLMKAGDSPEGITISLRIATARGTRLSCPSGGTDPSAGGRLLGASFFPALEHYLAGTNDDRNNFNAGYLFFASRLSDEKDSQAVTFLSKIPGKSPYRSSSLYYMARSEKILEKKEDLFNQSYSARQGNIEALYEVIRIKIQNNYLYEAYPLIKKINEHHQGSHLFLSAMAELFIKRKWHQEALKYTSALKNSPYPSSGYRHEAVIYLEQKKYQEAVKALMQLISSDSFNSHYLEAIISCHEKTGSYDDAVSWLHQAIALFPCRIDFRLRLARAVENHEGPSAALPYCTAAMNISPHHKDALFTMGNLYHKMNKRRLALYYFNLASRHDPDNFSLRRYLDIIASRDNETERYQVNDDAPALMKPALKYRDEAAVILLDETSFTINSDGSYEKRVRRVISVQDSAAINDFNNQYITIDPAAEEIENIRCLIFRDSRRIEITERFRKSLSDPRSRLYYNLEAIIIPISSLEPGTIIDLRYTIKNRAGNEYKGYFGEKIILGDTYRTIISRTVLVHPDSKRIYRHCRGVPKKNISVNMSGGKTAYIITMNNIKPYKKEPAMPHYSDIQPVVYFTSHRDWEEVSRWYRSLLKNRFRVDDAMRSLLKDLISQKDPPLTRVKKIYRFVTDEVRYVGFEFGIGGIQPRSADQTFHSRMGDCKDVSLLLAALLRASGISADLALVRTRDKGTADLSIPYIGEFNHAVCYVRVGDGFFIDGTARDTGISEIPSDIRDINALVISDSGYGIKNTGSDLYQDNAVTVTNRVIIQIDGTAVVSRTLSKKGDTAPEARESLKRKESRIKELNRYWNMSYPGSKVGNLTISGTDLDEPVQYTYEITIPGFAQSEKGEIIFNSNLIKSDFYRNYALLKKREFPVVLSGTWTSTTLVTYAIPPGYRAYHLPKNESYDHAKFKASFRYYLKPESVTVEGVVTFKSYAVTTDEYESFREFTRFINRKELEKIILVSEPHDRQ